MANKIKRQGKFWVYMVECSDGTYYTGYTNDLERRLKEHNDSRSRRAKYLRGKIPVKLGYVKEYSYYRNAVHAERDIKKRTRAEKEAMINAYQKRPLVTVARDGAGSFAKDKCFGIKGLRNSCCCWFISWNMA